MSPSDEQGPDRDQPSASNEPLGARARLLEVARLFGWLGIIGIGGPAAHIALMRRRVVERSRWVSEDEFVQLVGACALVPGPNSTEMAMALGGRRAGWRGLLLGGAAFIVPAFIIVCAVAFVYEDVLTSAVIADIRRWVVPVVAAIVLDALLKLRTTAVSNWQDFVVVALALVGAVLGMPELLVLAIVGGASIALRVRPNHGIATLAVPAMFAVVTPSLTKIFLVFLQIGSVIYGSGYVLLVFLESEVVNRGWISTEVLLDAITVGQFTPGPVFTTATFIGWHLSGFTGAALATLGIFGPSFVFAAVIERIVVLARSSRILSSFLRGVSSGSIALMAVVMVRLIDEAFVDFWAVTTFVVAFGVVRLRR